MPAFHVFVDETGQQSQGAWFILVAVIVQSDQLEALRARIAEVEHSSGRQSRKWVRTTAEQKKAYLEALAALLPGTARVFFRQHQQGTSYVDWTCAFIADALTSHDAQASYYVTIDGANAAECQLVARVLRSRGLQRERVRGLRDEAEPLLRLADALAGLQGDRHREKSYVAGLGKALGLLIEEL